VNQEEKLAKLPGGFPIGRLNLSRVIPRAISDRAVGTSRSLPPMVSPLGGQAPGRTPSSTQQGDVRTIQARGKGTLSETIAAKANQKTAPQDRSPMVSNGEALPHDDGANVSRGTGTVHDVSAKKEASARQLLREHLSDLRV
jgi:hypothetical protein